MKIAPKNGTCRELVRDAGSSMCFSNMSTTKSNQEWRWCPRTAQLFHTLCLLKNTYSTDAGFVVLGQIHVLRLFVDVSPRQMVKPQTGTEKLSCFHCHILFVPSIHPSLNIYLPRLAFIKHKGLLPSYRVLRRI